jgi:predicted ATP-dependent endonuclease of OLD family
LRRENLLTVPQNTEGSILKFKNSMMKLLVKNLGPIKQGEIDLSKRFFVFVGYNNTGKTYMAQVLWSVLMFWSDNYLLTRVYKRSYTFPDKLGIDNKWICEDVQKLLNYYQNELSERVIQELNNDSLKNFELDLSDLFKTFTNGTFKYFVEQDNMFYIFSKEKGNTDITIKQVKEIEYRNSTGGLYHNISSDEKITDYLYDFVVKSLNTLKIYQDPIFLPANRAFYPTFYRYIYEVAKEKNEEINKAIKLGKDINEINRLSKLDYSTAMDNLTRLVNSINRNRYQIANTNYQNFIDDLQKIMGGDIDIQRVEGFSPIEFKFKLNGTVLDMHAASSSVNQLTVLNTYFKYWASEKNNFLIMDEPEENLHPKNQLALLNLLMKFANQNDNKVLITTHSPLITDAVNNHLHLGYLKSLGEDIDALIEENHLNIDKDAAMAHEDIGVYFFDGQSIKPYEIGDYGVFFRDFRKYEKEVEDTSNLLTNRIYDILEKKNDETH